MKKYLSVNELDIVRALRVAVTRSVFGTGLVAAVLAHTTIGIHLGEIKSTVETTRKVGNINVEGELLVEEVEHLVVRGASWSHEVDTRSNVLVRSSRNKVEPERVTRGGDTVCTSVVGTIEGTVGSARHVIWAKSSVPGVSSIAVGISGGGVYPSPVSVEDNGTVLRCATRGRATLRALLERESRMGFGRVSADLLGNGTDGQERKGNECRLWEHTAELIGGCSLSTGEGTMRYI